MMQDETKEPAREFFQRREGWAGTETSLWLGVGTVAIGLVLLLLGSTVTPLLGGLIVIFTMRWAQKNPLVRVYDDHVEMKAAMLAAKHFVLFADVHAMRDELPKSLRLETRDGKTLAIPVRALRTEDATTLAELLRTRLSNPIPAGKAAKEQPPQTQEPSEDAKPRLAPEGAV